MVIRRTLRFSWYLGALLVVLLALAMLAGRMLFPLLEDYPATIERLVREQTGQRLTIGEMDFGWSAYGPEMRFHDVALHVEGRARPLIAIRELGIGLDLLDTLLGGRVVTRRIRLQDASLALVRTADGIVHLEGAPHVRSNFLTLLLDQPRLQASGVTLRFRDERLLPEGIRITDLAFDLRHRGDRRQLWFELRPEQALARRLQGGFDLAGWEGGLQALHGKWYLEGSGLGLEAIERRLWPKAAWQLAGVAELALWGDLEDGRPVSVIAESTLRLPSLIRRGMAVPVFVAGSLETRLRWQRTADGHRLDLDRLRIQQASQPYRETRGTLKLQRSGKGWGVRLGLDRLETGIFSGLVRTFASDLPPIVHALANARARLEDLQLAFRLPDGSRHPEGVRLATGFLLEFLPPYEQLPGVQHLAGRLRLGEGRGEAVLDSRDVVVEMPRLFDHRLSFDRLAGQVNWATDTGWRVRVSRLRLENRDLALVGAARLRQVAGRSTPEAAIDLRIERARVAAVPGYLPRRVMKPRPVHWLEQALAGGRVTAGHVRIHGNLGDLPFDRGRGRMDILARVEEGVLDYHPDWHRIEHIRADVRFRNAEMRIHSPSARILDVDLEDVTVGIRDLRRSPLTAEGQAHGAFESMLRYVRESPLAEGGYHVERLRGAGTAALDLSLEVPLRQAHGRQVRVKGALHLDHDRLEIVGYPVTFENIRGRVHFTHDGIEGRDLEARLWKAPIRLDIATLQDAEVTRVTLDGPIPVVARLREAGFPLAGRFSGEADWQARLDIGRGAAGMQMVLASELQGIGIDLPEPLGKPGQERRGFRLTTHLDEKGPGPLRVVYGKHSAAVELADEAGFRIRRAAVLFGGAAVELPDEPGLSIAGRLERLSLDAWRALLEQGPGRGISLPPLDRVELAIGELQLLGMPWRKVRLGVVRDAQLWRLEAVCDRLAGKATFGVPIRTTGLRLDLDRLDLPPVEDFAGGNGGDVRPESLPPLSVHVDRFALDGVSWGRLDLVTRPLPGKGLKVESATLESDWLHAEARGSWTRENGESYSRFLIRVRNTDMGRLLERAGYGEQLDGGLTTAELDANWPGAPWEFDLARIEGTLAIGMREGRLLRLRPGAGRLLGLLNLQAIPRRLTLDFSDLFKKGFVFDRLEGHFTFVGGDAYTTDLVIEAPSARIEIAGRTGLAARDYDEVVTVTPHIRSGLPIAGAIAGGPAVGAALLLADRLLGEKLDRMGQVQYRVTGPWEAPNFERLESDGEQP